MDPLIENPIPWLPVLEVQKKTSDIFTIIVEATATWRGLHVIEESMVTILALMCTKHGHPWLPYGLQDIYELSTKLGKCLWLPNVSRVIVAL